MYGILQFSLICTCIFTRNRFIDQQYHDCSRETIVYSYSIGSFCSMRLSIVTNKHNVMNNGRSFCLKWSGVKINRFGLSIMSFSHSGVLYIVLLFTYACLLRQFGFHQPQSGLYRWEARELCKTSCPYPWTVWSCPATRINGYIHVNSSRKCDLSSPPAQRP